jgi:DNA-binding NtrC family response regulator
MADARTERHVAYYQGELIGEHPSMQDVRRLVNRVATSPTRTVLIYGETGTGKGLVARMLHEQSARARNDFVDVNCAAIPSSLLESELFGHERGAFTGAATKKTGLVETANRGTIFLDEIREMDLTLQAKLLSVLDTQRFRRVGAVHPIEVDVRFITATNKILLTEVSAGHFREDLYYRLQVIAINIPPLRERGDDVLVLTEWFMRKLNARHDRSITGLSPEAREIFRRYPWPGNVRELENLLERIFILEDENRIEVRHLPDRIIRTVRAGTEAVPPAELNEPVVAANVGRNFHTATTSFQRRLVQDALAAENGNVSDTARRLGLSRHALRHQMIKLGLTPQ